MMDKVGRGYGCHVFGDEQDSLLNSLTAKQREAIGNARYGRDGWIIERCVASLRKLEILRQDSRGITPRGRQMMIRLDREKVP